MNNYLENMNQRILVIDDNEAIHGDFCKILGGKKTLDAGLDELMQAVLGETNKTEKENGYELASAYQGQDGFEIVRNASESGAPIALAFVDIRMPPGWDGIQTIRRIWDVDPNIEIVICTAYSDYSLDEIQKELKYSDQFMILKKPFDNIEVRQIASALTKKWNYARQAQVSLEELNHKVEERTNELHSANESLVKLNRQLRENQDMLIQSEKMASIGVLAAGVAHEINNPIGFIMSNLGTLRNYTMVFTELFRRNEELHSSIRRAHTQTTKDILDSIEGFQQENDISYIVSDVDSLLAESHDGAVRIRDIVQNLKSFARIDDGIMKEADINECIESTLKVISNEMRQKCEVRKSFGKLPLLQCYPQQLNQVFMNLVVNAVHAIVGRGVIHISTEARDGDIVIRVADTGVGIPPENLPKLFDPFFTTKPVGKGTGLGLSISHGIIQKHNGTIDVKSKPGKGTVFTIRLPVHKNAAT